MVTKETLTNALWKFAHTRAGLEFGNYGNVSAYRAESRAITRDLNDARILLRSIERSDISADEILYAMQHAFSGRLTWDGTKLDYCVGQYYPTEYRKAVCAVCAYALWRAWRLPYIEGATLNEGERLRKRFRANFGRGIASRWFH